jgi:hypothetical protein
LNVSGGANKKKKKKCKEMMNGGVRFLATVSSFTTLNYGICAMDRNYLSSLVCNLYNAHLYMIRVDSLADIAALVHKTVPKIPCHKCT